MSERFEVVIYNDDETPFAFVVDLLQNVFDKSRKDAEAIAQECHAQNRATLGRYTAEVATVMAQAVRERAEAAGFPLRAQALAPASRCGFCGKAKADVRHLIAGKQTAICDACVLASAEVLHATAGRQSFARADELLAWHFGATAPELLVTATRLFPLRMRADLQTALQTMLHDAGRLVGIHGGNHFEPLDFNGLLEPGPRAKRVGPLRYEEVDVGEERPKRCLDNGLWLGQGEEGVSYAVLMARQPTHMGNGGISVEVAIPAGTDGSELAQNLFERLERAVKAAQSYRGKVLSLEQLEDYSGLASGILVHKLAPVARDEVILPAATLAAVERNVLDFATRRDALRKLGQSTKKGLLFHGPPGTGKSHTIRYLANNFPGHTTLIVTAQQLGLIGQYFSLARLLQPAVMVLEDVDLIARNRADLDSPVQEVLLNQLLNEMDGLREDADIFIVLTTNRPELLEPALAGRPGRIDQAVEFPLPDEDGRQRLVALYGQAMDFTEALSALIVKRTEGVSAAFIKELVRRLAQSYLERGADAAQPVDVDIALTDMLADGNALNSVLLGGA